MTEFQKLTIKDLEKLLNCSTSTAKRYMNDIKQYFDIKKVLLAHFKEYFKV